MATPTMNHSAVAGGRSFGAIRGFLAIAGATMRCASAVESGHIPNPRDLKALGITQPLPGGQLLGR